LGSHLNPKTRSTCKVLGTVSKNTILNILSEKRCVIVCGGGGVGKTTTAAGLAIAATRVRQKVLVVTIDPAKRLAEAFGFTQRALEEGGEPLVLSAESKRALGIHADVELSVGILNPKYVLDQIVSQTLSPVQSESLKKTMLYTQLSEMVYGLQEYTAYEWVTRMIKDATYDLIILDTPPSFHAKDFFLVPGKIRNLMESKVFQLFAPKRGGFFKAVMSFGWIEKLLGEKVYRESRMFLETFSLLRDRILDRCELLSRFFTQNEVAVVAVTTPESSAMFELEGLHRFLRERSIHLNAVVVNQVEQSMTESMLSLADSDDVLGAGDDPLLNSLSPELLGKLHQLEQHQEKRAEKSHQAVEKCRLKYPEITIVVAPMVYSSDGFEILKKYPALF
jgi:anion-transporting  ArsA/GET3 family ATPase